MKYILVFYFAFLCIKVNCQSTFQIESGLLYSNINFISYGDQVVFPAPYGRPNYYVGYRLGIHNRLFKYKKLNFMLGLRYERKGANQYIQQIAPFDSLYDVRVDYIQFPVTASIKLLRTKEIYFNVGLTPGILMGINKRDKDLDALNVIVSANNFNLDLNVGFSFGLYRGLSVQVEYLQGLSNIEKDFINTSGYEEGQYHHAFGFSLKYAL